MKAIIKRKNDVYYVEVNNYIWSMSSSLEGAREFVAELGLDNKSQRKDTALMILVDRYLWDGEYESAYSMAKVIESSLTKFFALCYVSAVTYFQSKYKDDDLRRDRAKRIMQEAVTLWKAFKEAPVKYDLLDRLVRNMVDMNLQTDAEALLLSINTSVSFKMLDGELWYVGNYSNRFQDNRGDIISEEAHLQYIEWLNETGIKPPIIQYHQPHIEKEVVVSLLSRLASEDLTAEEVNQFLYAYYDETLLAVTERVVYIDGFVFVFGKVPQDRYEMVEKLQETYTQIGMSHGSLARKDSDNDINKYWAFEYSVLAPEDAANQFNVPSVFVKG